MIVCSCTGCGKRLKAKDELAGKNVRCPGCGNAVAVPATGPAAVSTEAWPAKGDVTAAAGGAEDPTARLDFPRAIGRFHIIDTLGAGGFGRVYKAYDPQLDREVAVKVPLHGTLESREDAERFLREARAAATLRHPNICPVYEVGQEGDCQFLVMAYVHGKSLADHLKERMEPVPARQAALIVRKLARALAAAHAQGIVHRDLKPGNVLVDRDRNDVVVTDFGLARRFHAEDAERTQEGVVLGTPAYMAPEQAGGQRGDIGPACDIYSLGVILYEMLAGRRPFTGSTREVLEQVVRCDPEPPSHFRRDTDRRLESICLKAIARDRRDRYRSMKEFAAALDGYLKAAPAEEPPAAAPAADSVGFAEMIAALSAERQKETQHAVEEAVGRHARKMTRLVLAGLAFVSLLTAVGIAVVLLRPTKVVQIVLENKIDARLLQDNTVSFILDGQPLPAAELRKPIELALGEHTLVARRGDLEVQRYTFVVGLDTANKDILVEVTNKTPYVPPPPGERRPLYFANVQLAHRAWQDGDIESHWRLLREFAEPKPEEEDLRGFEFHYVWQLRQQGYVRCRGPQPNSGAWSAIRFSPDGKRLAGSWAFQKGYEGAVWDLGQSLSFSRIRDVGKVLHTFPERVLGFSADGAAMWGVAADGAVTKRDAGTGNAISTKPSPGLLPTLSADGRLLAAVDQKDRSVTVRDADTWAVLVTFPGQAKEASRLCFSPDGKQLATGWNDGSVRVWDIGTKRAAIAFQEHKNPVTALAYSPDGTRVASSDDYYHSWPQWTPGRLFVWEAATGKVVQTLEAHRHGAVKELEFSPDGAALATASDEVAPVLWDLATGRERRDFKGHFGVIEVVTFRPDGKYLAAGAHDGMWLYLWPVKRTQGPLTFSGHSAAVVSVAFRPDNGQLASLGADGSVALSEPRSGRKQLSLAWAGVARIGFSRDGSLLVGWAADGKAIQAASLPSGKPTPVPAQTAQETQDGPFRVLRTEQDGKRKTEVRDAPSNALRLETPEFPDLVFSGDGQRVALRHADGTVEVRELADGRSLWRESLRFGTVAAMALSPDGKRLFTIGSVFTSGPSRAVRVWDAETGLLALALREDRQLSDCLALSPNGKLLAGGSRDGGVHVWDADPASVPVSEPER